MPWKMYNDPKNPMHFVGSPSNSSGQQNSMSNMKSNICKKKTIAHNSIQDNLTRSRNKTKLMRTITWH